MFKHFRYDDSPNSWYLCIDYIEDETDVRMIEAASHEPLKCKTDYRMNFNEEYDAAPILPTSWIN